MQYSQMVYLLPFGKMTAQGGTEEVVADKGAGEEKGKVKGGMHGSKVHGVEKERAGVED